LKTTALCFALDPPDRNLGGGNIRQAYLLESLGRRVETHLVVAGRLEDPVTRSAMATVTELGLEPDATPSVWRRRVNDLSAAVLSRQPAEVRHAHRARRAIAAIVDTLPAADVVLVEHIGLAPLVRAPHSNRWALTMHNVPSVNAAQAAALAPGRRQAWMWHREQQITSAFEAWASSAYDLLFTVSDDDAAAMPGATVVVPNGVDIERITPTPLPREPRIVFTGTLGFAPNVDGAVWFCSEVVPRIRAAAPGVIVDLVGRSPVAEVMALAGNGVNVHTDVPDVVPFLQAARVAVVPLRLGSGTRLKALEAMAASRPVVGTSVGLAGLGVVNGRDALIVDDAAAMGDAIVGLLTDDKRCAELTDNALKVAEAHSWTRIGSLFTDALLDESQEDQTPATSR
jgi:glycosyltransferase involved in cell wall biosynthesis